MFFLLEVTFGEIFWGAIISSLGNSRLWCRQLVWAPRRQHLLWDQVCAACLTREKNTGHENYGFLFPKIPNKMSCQILYVQPQWRKAHWLHWGLHRSPTPAHSSVFILDKYRKIGALRSSFSHKCFLSCTEKSLHILSAEIFISMSLWVWQVLAQPGHVFLPFCRSCIKAQVREGHGAGGSLRPARPATLGAWNTPRRALQSPFSFCCFRDTKC